VFPGVASETMKSWKAQIDGLLTTSLDPRRFGIADAHWYAGVIRDFPTSALGAPVFHVRFPL
jgi:Zn-dependent M32 family carboxypeptidase